MRSRGLVLALAVAVALLALLMRAPWRSTPELEYPDPEVPQPASSAVESLPRVEGESAVQRSIAGSDPESKLEGQHEVRLRAIAECAETEFDFSGSEIELWIRSDDSSADRTLLVAAGSKFSLASTERVVSAALTIFESTNAEFRFEHRAEGKVVPQTPGVDSEFEVKISFPFRRCIDISPSIELRGSPGLPLCATLAEVSDPHVSAPKFDWLSEQRLGERRFFEYCSYRFEQSSVRELCVVRGDGTALGHAKLEAQGGYKTIDAIEWSRVGALRCDVSVEARDDLGCMIELTRAGFDSIRRQLPAGTVGTLFRWLPAGIWEVTAWAPQGESALVRAEVVDGKLGACALTLVRAQDAREVAVDIRMQSGATLPNKLELSLVDSEMPERELLLALTAYEGDLASVERTIVLRGSRSYRAWIKDGPRIDWGFDPAVIDGLCRRMEIVGLDGGGIVDIELRLVRPDGMGISRGWQHQILTQKNSESVPSHGLIYEKDLASLLGSGIHSSMDRLRVALVPDLRILITSMGAEFDAFFLLESDLIGLPLENGARSKVVEVKAPATERLLRFVDAQGRSIGLVRVVTDDGLELQADEFGFLRVASHLEKGSIRMPGYRVFGNDNEFVEAMPLSGIQAGEFRHVTLLNR